MCRHKWYSDYETKTSNKDTRKLYWVRCTYCGKRKLGKNVTQVFTAGAMRGAIKWTM